MTDEQRNCAPFAEAVPRPHSDAETAANLAGQRLMLDRIRLWCEERPFVDQHMLRNFLWAERLRLYPADDGMSKSIAEGLGT